MIDAGRPTSDIGDAGHAVFRLSAVAIPIVEPVHHVPDTQVRDVGAECGNLAGEFVPGDDRQRARRTRPGCPGRDPGHFRVDDAGRMNPDEDLALSALPGQFLIKDLALLGIALWTLGEAWKASQRRGPVH